MQVQNVRDFPQTEVDSEIKAPFLSNEHCDPRLTKNSLIKNIFEEEKQFNIKVEDDFFFLENSSQMGVFWPRRGCQANHGTGRKSVIF